MGILFDRVTAFNNLHASAWEVFRGKRSRHSANHFFLKLEYELFRLQAELKEGTYRPGEYRTFWIYEPKPRLISAAPLRDRVVHHAIIRVIEPLFERKFIYHSYACRVGKGNHRALTQFVAWSRQRKYALMLDIEKFFPSIDHEILKTEIRRGIKDRKIQRLIDVIIDGSNPQGAPPRWFPGDDLFAPNSRKRGLPIGNLTSQFFANVLMDRIDHFAKERMRAKRYLRYVDDLAAFSDDHVYLGELRSAIREELLLMRLRLNERKSRIRRLKEGLTYLGFTVGPHHVRLASSAVRRHRKRLKRLHYLYSRGELSVADIAASLTAFGAHAAHGDTYRLRERAGDRAFVRE